MMVKWISGLIMLCVASPCFSELSKKNMFGDRLYDRQGNSVRSDELNADIYALYFSAEWCAPCRVVTPKLVKFYNEVKESGGQLEVLLVSSDNTEQAMFDYMQKEEMPWFALEYDSPEAAELKRKFGTAVPQLVVMDSAGNVIANGNDGRFAVQKKGAKAWPAWVKGENGLNTADDRSVPVRPMGSSSPLEGVWVNADRKTQSLKKIEVSSTPQGTAQLTWWGSDLRNAYGPVPLIMLGESVRDTTPNQYGYAKHDLGWGDKVFFLRRDEDQVVVELLQFFMRGSGRANFQSTLRFKKEKGKESVTESAITSTRGEPSQNPLSIASFDSPESISIWRSVNDGVMGGLSTGGFTRSDRDTLLFSGVLSLENRGGFASIRTKPRAMNLGGANGIVIKARGDGRTYHVNLRTPDNRVASSYRADLPTIKGEFVEVMIPFSDFKLQAFGKFVPDSKAIDPAAIHSVGFSIADEQAGPFEIEIEPVKAFQGQSNAAGNTKKRS